MLDVCMHVLERLLHKHVATTTAATAAEGTKLCVSRVTCFMFVIKVELVYRVYH